MKEKYYLYQHIRLDKNEPFYIGIGTIQKSQQSSIKQEILYYRAFSKIRRNSIRNKIVNKTDYSIEILITSDNYDFIKSKEIELIEKYGKIYLNTGILSNLTDGGEGTNGYKASIQTRKKYSKRMINTKFSEETKLKMSISRQNRIVGTNNKIVLSLEDGIFYNFIREVSKIYNISYQILRRKLSQNNSLNFKLV